MLIRYLHRLSFLPLFHEVRPPDALPSVCLHRHRLRQADDGVRPVANCDRDSAGEEPGQVLSRVQSSFHPSSMAITVYWPAGTSRNEKLPSESD